MGSMLFLDISKYSTMRMYFKIKMYLKQLA